MIRIARAVTVIGAALLLTTILSGCGNNNESMLFSAVGSYGDIAVMTSRPDLYEAASPFFDRLNPEVSFVLKREDTYNIRHFTRQNWKDARNYRNLIFLVRWGDGGPLEKELKKLLSEKSLQRLTQGRGGVVTVFDPYFRNQQAIIAISTNRQVLLRTLNQKAEDLAGTLRDGIHKRMIVDHRRDGIRTELVDHLWQRHGYVLEIPRAFNENQTEPDGFPGLEWLRTDGATRGITLSWTEAEHPDRVLRNQEALIAIRSDLGQNMHSEELIPASFQWSEDELGGVPVTRLSGAWKSTKVSVGGPFWCYFIPDPASERVICIDLLVYGPDREKMNDFRRLRAIAETFSLQQPQP
jgi:hypothetical protein